MLKFLFLVLLAWPVYYFLQHPEDISNPEKILNAAKDYVENKMDAVPLLSQLTEHAQPGGILIKTTPIISHVNASPWNIGKDTFTPLLGYEIQARVLSKLHYFTGRESDYSPYDLALGWQEMSDSNVLSQLQITQVDRWYNYAFSASSTLNANMIPLKSDNIHMIPSTGAILQTLQKIAKGDVIEATGYLVTIQSPDGWQWKSGTKTTAESEGTGKVLWLTSLRIE